ncbi:2,5-diamino-6-(ribosylamino)-4(3H)-pyrimidinone 5'-phosphate reductase [Halopelagius longus]|uniref:2,5-diamino-6-(ribosylamino)-4(3H)-pyrimidinone 5'-phosphate reductase n=1 Tax=Halopelagius longus TaxID=1236180 RepID=A0A1H1B2C2_9EURY|nr:2,5-diamino-6-(ribosylamino)-4(3H)-pyrimidinone 5'-phosphate reductase [Halopelagius longus]RDI70614.1 2,5-diamino-6-(ribosylamino)-4(3H)-pyrimidinone 5'-phosphate reductase [Halopelagius longus]SDQ46095.1 2,5-diamino-6-(5-phosphoribosylamino)pyrimidin-4(3H)-one reductase [Halopelagius longus]
MHVVVNAAASVDGKLSNRRREQVEISGDEDFARVDRVRAENDAVLVGVGTVLADDPHLTVDGQSLRATRQADGRPANPARVVADSRGRTPTDARILDGAADTYVLVSEAAPENRIEALESAGATVVVAGADRVSFSEAFESLETCGVESVMVEGGGEVIFSLFEEGVADELRVYVGSIVIGGRDAPTLADGEGFVEEFPTLSLREVERLDDGVLLSYDVA